MKVSIYGYSGSGKSTLARSMGKKYGCEVLHLDRVHWLPGWIERGRVEEQQIVTHFLDEHDSWVIDGNYSAVEFARRMEEADRIIFMNFNRFTCFWRAWKRYLSNKGKVRESMTEGCEEKFDLEFARWILYEGRTGKRRAGYERTVMKYRDKTIVIKNQRQLDNFMQKEGITRC